MPVDYKQIDSLARLMDTLQIKLDSIYSRVISLSKDLPAPIEHTPRAWIFIFALAGIIGGITAFYFPKEEPTDPPKPKLSMLAYILFGLVASFAVPAFLYLVRSEFLNEAITKESAMWAMFGLALIVSVFGQQFILKMWNMASEMKEAKKKIDSQQEDITFLKNNKLDK